MNIRSIFILSLLFTPSLSINLLSEVYADSCAYNLEVTPLTLTLGENVTAKATTNNTAINSVKFNWIRPDTSSFALHTDSQQLYEDVITPDIHGQWEVKAFFSNGIIASKNFNVTFMVIPESSIGTLLLLSIPLGMLAILLFKRNYKSYNLSILALLVIISFAFFNESMADTSITLASPYNLTATLESPSSVRLTWQSDTIGEFHIERSIDGMNFVEIAVTQANTYLDTGLSSGTISYRVRAYEQTCNIYSDFSTASITISGSGGSGGGSGSSSTTYYNRGGGGTIGTSGITHLPIEVLEVKHEPLNPDEHDRVTVTARISILAVNDTDRKNILVKLFYSTVGEEGYKKVIMERVSDDLWKASIPASDIKLPGVTYWLSITDRTRVDRETERFSIDINHPEPSADTTIAIDDTSKLSGSSFVISTKAVNTSPFPLLGRVELRVDNSTIYTENILIDVNQEYRTSIPWLDNNSVALHEAEAVYTFYGTEFKKVIKFRTFDKAVVRGISESDELTLNLTGVERLFVLTRSNADTSLRINSLCIDPNCSIKEIDHRKISIEGKDLILTLFDKGRTQILSVKLAEIDDTWTIKVINDTENVLRERSYIDSIRSKIFYIIRY